MVALGIGLVLGIVTLVDALRGTLTEALADVYRWDVYVERSQPPPNASLGSELRLFAEHDVPELKTMNNVRAVALAQPLQGGSLYAGNHALPVSRVVAQTRLTPFFSLAAGRAPETAQEVVVGAALARQLLDGNAAQDDAAGLARALDEPLTLKHAQDGEIIEKTVRVVGVLQENPFEPKTTNLIGGFNNNDAFVTASHVSPSPEGRRLFEEIQVQVHRPEAIELTESAVQRFVVERRMREGLTLEGPLAFTVQFPDEVSKPLMQSVNRAGLIVGLVGGVTLLVGMVGIAIVIILSVSERTPELGILQALGATSRDLRRWILLEGALFGLQGALVGFGLSVVGFFALKQLIFLLAEGELALVWRWSAGWTLIAVLGGILMGTVSGLYPAHKASRLDPVEALKR